MRTPVGSCSAWPWEQARPSSPPTSDCPHTSAQSRPPTPSALRCYPSLPASWSCPSSSHLTIVRAAHSLCPCLPRWASAKPPPDSLAGLATFPRLITAAPQFFQSWHPLAVPSQCPQRQPIHAPASDQAPAVASLSSCLSRSALEPTVSSRAQPGFPLALAHPHGLPLLPGCCLPSAGCWLCLRAGAPS